MNNNLNHNKKPINQFLNSIDNLEVAELRGMKDSVTNFFTDWVKATHDTGYLERNILLTHTHHFTTIQDLINDIIEYKSSSLNFK